MHDSKYLYKFGDQRYQGLSLLTIQNLISSSHAAKIRMKISDVDVLFLFGLDVLNLLETNLCFENNHLMSNYGA